MAPVRVVRAFRLPIIAVMTTLALSGCMRTSSPVAVAQPQSDLDSMAYGQPYIAAPPLVAVADSGGAISALRASFAAAPGRSMMWLTGSMPATSCGSWSMARRA
jgi:polysaccharide export outer membrane protein